MLVTQSCIVADPPQYRDALRTRPLLDTYKALPPTQQVLVVHTDDPNAVKVSVPVRSEDAGEYLAGRLFLDYQVQPGPGTAGELLLRPFRIPPSTYDDSSRSADAPWTPRPLTSPGCHLLTLIVAHESTFIGADQNRLDPAKAGDDAAIINWWVNVDPTTDLIHTLVNCPVSGGMSSQ